MISDEESVKQYFEALGFFCERFSRNERRAGKTPDFRVVLDDKLEFYCEVKSIVKGRWLTDQFENVQPFEIVGGLRSDPVFNRLTDDIHTATKQFDAVNPSQIFPNVLALVNHDDLCDLNDLKAVLTGNFYTDDGKSHPIYKQFSEGRIRNSKDKIHLFLWFDGSSVGKIWSQTDNELHLRLCNLLKINSNNIQQISP